MKSEVFTFKIVLKVMPGDGSIYVVEIDRFEVKAKTQFAASKKIFDDLVDILSTTNSKQRST